MNVFLQGIAMSSVGLQAAILVSVHLMVLKDTMSLDSPNLYLNPSLIFSYIYLAYPLDGSHILHINFDSSMFIRFN